MNVERHIWHTIVTLGFIPTSMSYNRILVNGPSIVFG